MMREAGRPLKQGYGLPTVEKFKPFLIPGVAAVIYLAWWLFGPVSEAPATNQATDEASANSPAPAGRGRAPTAPAKNNS
jgi:hypothetical protein